MDPRPGLRVRVRGLVWDVLEVDGVSEHERLHLRCAEGDMAGLLWDVLLPLEPVELVDDALDPSRPAPLALWHLMHRARVLNEIPLESSFVARKPGRVRFEAYQLVPLMRALDMPRARLLLADGVGLGKTIQASLIVAEFIARRRAHRILIVTPSGPLLRQWEQETRLRFGLKFTLITSASELWEVRRKHELGANPFDSLSLCITALDFSKQDHILEELERTTWDLVIIDEAHHCAGFGAHASRENTQRRRLAEVLARCSDGLLLLTATPHDGHDAHFASLIALLDPSLVDGAGGFVGRDYRRHVIRRMKVHIRDPHTGAALFHRRLVVHVKVDVGGTEHAAVREFHRALSAFVVPRLRRRPGADDALAFVSLLKRSVSTISACLETLRVVAERVAGDGTIDVELKSARRERARALRAWRRHAARFGSLSEADEFNQEALEIESMTEALRVEPDNDLTRLIRLGCAAQADDPKLSAIILEVRLIRLRHHAANILIYTEYTDSQVAAARALRAAHGIEGEVISIGGQDDERARAIAAQRFAEHDRLILISTDALAEGLNLHQRCFHLIHLDLPYNPNRLEQRNGRIDRYGQREEPEIRYLYIPGTFEERLLLHLITKYERARSFLDVMPDTLGVTADTDHAATLTGGLSEDPDDLFQADVEAIRTLDQAAGDINPGIIAELTREIDRAFGAFDLMAVCHGWYGARGFNADQEQANRADRLRRAPDCTDDLPNFIAAVIEAEGNAPAIASDEIRLPPAWVRDFLDLPGFDPKAGVARFTRDFDTWRDSARRDVGYFGSAHPLVLRAIRHGCRLPGAVAVSRGEHLGLLLTFEMEIAIANRIASREIIAVIAAPEGPPAAFSHWLSFGSPEHSLNDNRVWDRLFAPWAERALSEARQLLGRIERENHKTFCAGHEALRQEETARSRRWLRVRADLLCGPFIAPSGDLFGGSAPGPMWRGQEDPAVRLVSFARDRDVAAAKRREANEALEIYQAMEHSPGAPGPIISRPIGMLMLVPRDAA